MKRHINNFLTTTLLTLSSPAFASGIPVIDVSSLAQSILQVQHLLTQIEEMRNQIQVAEQELNSMSGVRGMASLIDSAYDPSVTINPEEVLSSFGINTAASYNVSDSAKALFNNKNQDVATWLGQSQKSLLQAQTRFDELTGLIAKVNNSPDQKDILDLSARIGAEHAMLQNEMIKLTMLRSEAEAKQAIHNQRIQQMAIESSGTKRKIDW